MCGIFGFIGRPINKDATFELCNALLVKTEKRGHDATGFWACEIGKDGKICYDKEAVKASVYQERAIWKEKFANTECDLLLAHCRASTAGNEKINKNNHPHVSTDKRIALIHNGKVTEYGSLKYRYDLTSDCDSEILLRMYEHGEAFRNNKEFLEKEFPDAEVKTHQKMGLKEIFSRIQFGAMAVAIGERGSGIPEENDQRLLWLFRNEERPLIIIDMRETLGQIFFCSELDIWRSSVEACPGIKEYFEDHPPIIEFPAHQAWRIRYSPKTKEEIEELKWTYLYEIIALDNLEKKHKREIPTEEWKKEVAKVEETKAKWESEVTPEQMKLAIEKTQWQLNKNKIIKTKFFDWDKNQDNSKVVRPKGENVTELITRLNDEEDIIVKTITPSQSSACSRSIGFNNSAISTKSESDKELQNLSLITDFGEINMAQFDETMKELRATLSEMENNIKALEKEKKLTEKEFFVIMSSLKDALSEVQGTQVFLSPR